MKDRILPIELKEKIRIKEDFTLLDVRTVNESKIAKINNSILIPIEELKSNLIKLNKSKEIIVYCHHGIRSQEATDLLNQNGFNAKSLVGGIDVWSRFIDNSIPQY